MHPMLRVLALSLALAAPAVAQAAERDAPSGTLTVSTTSEKVAGTAAFPTLANDSGLTIGVPAVLCRDPAGRMVTPTAKGCASVEAQPIALDDPDLNPAYFDAPSNFSTSHQNLIADLAKYKGNEIILYLSSGRSMSGVLTDVDHNRVGFRLDHSGVRLKIDPGRIEGFGEMGE